MGTLMKEHTTKIYNKYAIIIQESKEYAYSSREERDLHSLKMQEKGWSDSGQYYTNTGSIMNPIHIPYAIYYKETVEENR